VRVGNPCQRRDAVRGASCSNPWGGPILAHPSVSRRSLYLRIASFSFLVLSQNRLRHGVKMWSDMGLAIVFAARQPDFKRRAFVAAGAVNRAAVSYDRSVHQRQAQTDPA
jgi:hypothetical protein